MENHRCWRLAIFGINKNIIVLWKIVIAKRLFFVSGVWKGIKERILMQTFIVKSFKRNIPIPTMARIHLQNLLQRFGI